jgi:plasmid stability protein
VDFMRNIVLRKLHDAALVALRKRAAASGTSTEEQAGRVLAQAVGLDRGPVAGGSTNPQRDRAARRSVSRDHLRHDRRRD